MRAEKGHDGNAEKRQVVAVESDIFKGHHGNGRGHRRQLPSMPLCNFRAAIGSVHALFSGPA